MNIALLELKSLRRWDEYICTDLSKEIDNIINPVEATPTEKQRAKKLLLRYFRQCPAIYFAKASPDMLTENQRYFGEALGNAIFKARESFSDKIVYFSENLESGFLQFVPEEMRTTFLRRNVRLIVGHERRHKQQHWIERNADEILLNAEPGLTYNEAREQDAHWWAWIFNEYWFGDDVLKI